MNKILITIFLFLFMAVSVNAAFLFDEVNDYITLADNPALTLPDGDWTIAFWMKVPDLTGSGAQQIMNWGGDGAAPSMQIYIGEASSGIPGRMSMHLKDSDGDVLNVDTATGVITTGTWLHIVWARTSNTLKCYVDNVEKGSATNALYDDTNVADSLYIGVRANLEAASHYGGELAELAKWNKFLSAAERAALANGYAPSVFPESLAWYMPMIREYQEIMVPLTVTNNGTTVTEHPRMLYPN